MDIAADDFPNCWNWPESYGWNADTITRGWTEVEHCGYFWQALHPYATAEGDIKHLQALSALHEIYMVTNRRGVTAKKETEKWLHGRGLHNPTVIICKDKGTLCKGLGADIIIDDSPDNLLDVYGASIKTKCVMFKRPWNVGYWGHFPGTVSTVREALSDIK